MFEVKYGHNDLCSYKNDVWYANIDLIAGESNDNPREQWETLGRQRTDLLG